jgi:hypothetical protein
MKVSIRITTVFGICLLFSLCAYAGLEAERKAVSEHPNFTNLQKALTRFAGEFGGEGRATLIIPKYRDENEDAVIFWVEERALFNFALNFGPEVVDSPILVSRRFRKFTKEFFYPSDSQNPGHHSSTFMDTWDWAKERVFDAIKDGYILTVQVPEKPEPSDPPNDGPATSVDNSDISGGGRHR